MVNVPWCHDCDEPDGLCKCVWPKKTQDLSELKRLAEAAIARPDATDNDRLAIRPSTILSLIARVEKAEARVKELEAEIAFRPPKAKYPPFSSTPTHLPKRRK